MSQTQRFGTEYDGRSRQDLASLLLEETTRRWQPPEEQADLPSSPLAIPRPQTDDELADFLADSLGVRFPRTPVCQGHSTPFAALCDAFFARGPVTVWKASRAFGGKTLLMGALAWAEALALRSSVTILGGTGEQSARVHEYLRDFWRSPSAPPGTTSNATATKTRLIWGNTVTALTASMAAVSGPHPQRLRIDEVDLVDIGLLDQALGQPMSRGGVDAHVLLSSAHYTDNGTLTEVLKRAGPKGWHVHEWCWRETVEPYGWLARSEIERQRRVVTEEMWRVQYDLQEPNPEGRAIAPAKVERMFQGPSLQLADRDGCVPYREFEPPVDGATYATGSDWARMKDYVEIVTLRDDVWPMRLVAYQRFRKREIGYLVAAFDKQVTRFPGNSAHDATSMGGSFMHDLVGVDESVEGFVMVGARRRALFNDYIVGVEFEEIVAPRIESLYQQHRTCRNADLFKSGPKDHPPDGVVACAMAYHASQASTRPLEVHRPRDQDPLAKIVTHADPEPVVVQRSALGRALSAFSRKPDGNGNGHNGGNGNGSE